MAIVARSIINNILGLFHTGCIGRVLVASDASVALLGATKFPQMMLPGALLGRTRSFAVQRVLAITLDLSFIKFAEACVRSDTSTGTSTLED